MKTKIKMKMKSRNKKIRTRNKKTRIRNRKTRTKIIARRTRNKKTRIRGGSVLGQGKDGCIIDSISCGKFSKENGYVAKILYNGKQINNEVNDTLARLDPNNERYNRYFLPELELEACLKTVDYNEDFLKCTKNKNKTNINVVFEKKLYPFNNKKMTKTQYRYLHDSLKILHDNNVSHGDLPENVMMDPTTHMPIIIDWEEAKIDADVVDKQIDRNAFLDNYKVSNLI